jgi:predicted O-methyltransferase YrrM
MDRTAAQADAYLDSKLLHPLYGGDEALTRGRQKAEENNIPDIAVSPQQGQFLSVLVKGMNASKILEIGTLWGWVVWYLLI